MYRQVKIGDKFKYLRTSPFGKEIEEIITVVAIVGTKVIFDTGFEYPLAHFTEIINK